MTVAPGPWPTSAKRTTFGPRVAGTLALTKRRFGSKVRLAHASRAGSSPMFVEETVAARRSEGVAWVGANVTGPDGIRGARAPTDHEAVWGGNNAPSRFWWVRAMEFVGVGPRTTLGTTTAA